MAAIHNPRKNQGKLIVAYPGYLVLLSFDLLKRFCDSTKDQITGSISKQSIDAFKVTNVDYN
jgi:hypothetical protein